MPESENALWAKTRRRNMTALRRQTKRSESAAERAHKAPPTAAPAAPPLSGGGAPKSVGGAKNGFVMRFFALQPFL